MIEFLKQPRLSLLLALLSVSGCVSPLGTDWSQRVGISASMPNTVKPEISSVSIELNWER